MIAVGVLLVLLGAGLATLSTVRLSAANAGRRMPLVGLPPVRPLWPRLVATTCVLPAAAGAALVAHARHALAGWAVPAALVLLVVAGTVPVLIHNAGLP